MGQVPDMAAVEVRIIEENAINDVMAKMREWLDHRSYQPTTFRYTFAASCILCKIVFALEAEAAEFARAFDGRIVAANGETAGANGEPLAPIP